MKYALVGANVFIKGKFVKTNISVCDGIVVSIDNSLIPSDFVTFDVSDKYIFPGFIDVHVHLREPGFSYKETIKTGTLACAHGGYTTVCTMPNLSPVPDSLENLNVQLDLIKKDAVIEVIPFGAITKKECGIELAEFEEMADFVCGFSDDGKGVQSEEMMRRAMLKAKSLEKIISAHCEDNSKLFGGYIHDGEYAKAHSHRGISSESEWAQIERDLRLAKETGVKYHVCHISTKESVDLIRRAKLEGVDVSCETAPHYLILDDSYMQEDARFKMNPPLRDRSDRLALIEGIKDGTIDVIATDHAPHSKEEKSLGLEKSPMGITGIESAFPLLYTHLVKKGVINLEKLITLLNTNPRKRFNIGTDIEEGKTANFTVFDLNKKYTVTEDFFLSMGKSSPFTDSEVYGKCLLTVYNGKTVYSNINDIDDGGTKNA